MVVEPVVESGGKANGCEARVEPGCEPATV